MFEILFKELLLPRTKQQPNYVICEDTYLKIISKNDKTETAYFPELLNIVILTLENDPFDFLGYIYMGSVEKFKNQ
uniref:Uncharacterized protein n=1 Tax=Carnobacterium maltaromaticum TaxID=2751 RepID=A0A1Z5AWV7_CARML|nr:protein of unknown function [Carnobacterium maltaromaticum]